MYKNVNCSLSSSCYHFVVVGDDPFWNKRTFTSMTLPVNVHFSVVKKGSPTDDMCLLKQCDAVMSSVSDCVFVTTIEREIPSRLALTAGGPPTWRHLALRLLIRLPTQCRTHGSRGSTTSPTFSLNIGSLSDLRTSLYSSTVEDVLECECQIMHYCSIASPRNTIGCALFVF